jgi:hypothetical protein
VRTLPVTGIVVAGLLVLSACNDQSSSAGTEPTRSPALASPTSSAPAPSAPASQPGGMAAPKAHLSLGAAANVPFTSDGKTSTESVAVTAIRKGSPSDLASLKMGDRVKGMVPYYIHATIKNTGTIDLSFTNNNHIKGLLADGAEAQDLSVIGTFPKCDGASAPSGFTTGKSYPTCAIALAPSAATAVTGAEYWGDPYGLEGALTWK